MTTKAYQTFEDQKGASDSPEKLKALRLPPRMTGKSVLDVGCNEGFFLFDAARRGATKLLGIDASERFINAAKARAEAMGIPARFERMSAYDAPSENWDVVFVLSVIHYFDHPARFFGHMREVMAPDGVMVLECGVAGGPGRTMRRALRSIDDRFFPSEELLIDGWLRDFAVKIMGPSAKQKGDPIERRVLHCYKRLPRVVMILGEPGHGKSEFAREIGADVVLNTDQMMRPASFEGATPNRYQARYSELMATGIGHGATWKQLREDSEAIDYFAGVVAEAITLNRGMKAIAVEGYILADLVDAIQQKIGPAFKQWLVHRV